MAKKRKKIEAKRLPTKQQLSKWERQKKLQRLILIFSGIFFALVLAFIGYGYYDSQIKPFGQKVLKVNDTIIDMNYYLGRLVSFLPAVDSTQALYAADMIIAGIVRDELILQRAPRLGITVNDVEIEDGLTKLKLPDTKLYRDMYAADTLADRLMSVYFEPKVPTTAKQADIQAMFLESIEVANEVLDMLNENESFLQLAKRFSTEEFTKEMSGELGWIVEGAENLANGKFSNSLLDDIAFDTEVGTVSKPTYDPSVVKTGGYWLLEVIERDKDNSSHVKGILVGSESEALELQLKLKGGAGFDEVAKEKSQHLESKDSGGDLGFIRQGYSNDTILKSASELPIGTLSTPIFDKTVQTKGGYWLVKVLEASDDRQLDVETRGKLKTKAFQDWLEEERKSSDIELYIDEKQKAWAVDYAFKKLGVTKK